MSVGGSKLTSVPLGWLSRDARLIILARGLRAFGQGTVSVLLAIYLDLLGFSLIQIGLFISAGLAGAAFCSFLIVFLGDALGRRRLLVAFALLPATAALVLTATDSFPLLAAVALLGSFGVAGGGAAAGPAQPVEQVSLADMVQPERRTDLYALYGIMVFTHIPSSLLLIAIPFLPTAWLAASFWLARGFFSQMDVPPRQSYTMAVVGPNERVAMAGINTVARSMAGTVSPSVAAVLWNIGAASIPFISCGVLKISYDLSLYFMFRNVRPPEEQVRVETARQP